MPVNSLHADYIAMQPVWEACRAVAHGQRAVHDAGEKFLPRLSGQADKEYEAYKCRALFYNATERTIEALVGMLFRRKPEVTVPASVRPLLDDITQSGIPFDQFQIDCGQEYMEVGRFGILDDYPEATARTRADALRLNLRPTMTLYKAESIINWATTRVGQAHVLSLVVLTEDHAESTDEFATKTEPRWRVLDLDQKGRYRVRLFRKGERQDEFVQIGDDIYPMKGGKEMNRIPFEFFPRVKPCKPPLLDLIDVNLSHYRVTADYEHGVHFVGLPTAYITGHVPAPNEKFHIGGSSALVFPNPETNVAYLEFTGDGLGACERNLDRKEKFMAILGARMLEAQKRDSEAAETAGIYRSGENAALGTVADQLSLCFTRSLTTFSEWAGANGEVLHKMHKDYVSQKMTPDMLREQIGAWQSGVISYETLFSNLQAGEIVSPETTAEEEQTAIEASPPRMMVPEDQIEDDNNTPPKGDDKTSPKDTQ